ncbi:hypothetical protein V8J88_20645 [Massilia sp. W12]|uniref:hypothetical protein n=1 Tax=Massilia sp. W12 TaxID=3126507 RepID=UPI0030CCE1C7
MSTIIIDCRDVSSEAGFWQLYLLTVRPEGAQFFGRNKSAFRDAICGGGPGWPGEVDLRFIHTASLAAIDQGNLLRFLQEMQDLTPRVRILPGADH